MADRIHGVAVDAGSGLAASLRDARGATADSNDPVTFKRAVLEELGQGATTVLLDAKFGPGLLQSYPEGCARMLAYEADVYKISNADRITILPDDLSLEVFPDLGVEQLKFFMYYAPDDDPDLNARKHRIVEEIGARCRAVGVKFLMEPLVYHRTLEPGSRAYAEVKPDLVTRATETFAADRFQVDVLKVEVPVDLAFVEGFGEPHMSRAQALDAFSRAAEPADGKDLVYLSAGVAFEAFEASLELANEAGVDFSGFMCGRALWSDAVSIFGDAGETRLRAWLRDTGLYRLRRLIKAAA